ncbi:hypothetical protein HMPREF0578_1196 [Mobiluncus mulieris 28-1]|uniref:hypothetical protein n=1 Tax=Mobiluncus mulieris TaxID=2052 RepID=UPI0001BE7AF6|nr:hypothetical protein [Mobiluncus mulieris]EEZ91962.1 hypothetical protein HMPREF0578_1196 [Mobiluncus mulieris 28-1]
MRKQVGLACAYAVVATLVISSAGVVAYGDSNQDSSSQQPKSYSIAGTRQDDVPPPPAPDASATELYRYYVDELEEMAKMSPQFNNLPQAAELREARSVMDSKATLTETEAQAELDRLKPQMLREWREMIAENKARDAKIRASLTNQPCDPDINGIQNCPWEGELFFDDNPSMLSLIGYHNGLTRTKILESTRVSNPGVITAAISDFQEQQRDWWCGPASTRNLVHGFTKGSWNIPQSGLASKWGITHGGSTYLYQVIDYLNEVQFNGYGHWTYKTPTSVSDLISTIHTAINQHWGKAVILDGVPTRKLSYWRGSSGSRGHYDVGIGVNYNNNKILVGEVYGKQNVDNPEGPFHWEPAGNVYKMVTSNPGYVVYSTK